MLGIILRFTHPRFSAATRKGIYEFLVICEDMLYNLGSVERHGLDYTIFQFNLASRH